MSPRLKRWLKPVLLGGLSLAIVVATFVYFLPTIADYGKVWDVVQGISTPWVAALAAATLVNVLTFAPPWQVALPGLSFIQALTVTQASTALSIVVPGGLAAGVAGSFAVLRRWGFPSPDITRAITLTGLWNQFLNLTYPIVGVFALTVVGEQSAALATAAFIGVAVLGVVVTGFVVILVSNRLAEDIGTLAARVASWTLAKIRRGPVSWSGASFERFRESTGHFVKRRWHVLTATSAVGSLSVFAVLLVTLRAVGVPSSEVSTVEAFAAWSLVRIVATIPITPGGLGVVELALSGALVGFGGGNAHVVAAVLLYRFLTTVPTLVLGLAAAFTWRRQRRPAEPTLEA